MISYVECLGGDGAGHGMAARCWNGSPDDEQDELLPRKLAALHPKTEGSLRRRLLSARIHQHYDAIMAVNGGGVVRLDSPAGDKKPLPAHFQSSGGSPWYRHQHFSPRAHVHPSLTPETHGKLFSAPDVYGKPNQHPAPLQEPWSTSPVIAQRSQTPTPEASPGYAGPDPSPIMGPAAIRGQEVPPQCFYQPGRVRRSNFFRFRPRRGRKSGLASTQTTPLLGKGITWRGFCSFIYRSVLNFEQRWNFLQYHVDLIRGGLLPPRSNRPSQNQLYVCCRFCYIWLPHVFT